MDGLKAYENLPKFLEISPDILNDNRLNYRMMKDNTQIKESNPGKFIRNVLIKGILLFLLLNFAIALIPKGMNCGFVSAYNHIFPGRSRLPFGENPKEAYNLSLYDLEVMFASHEIDGKQKPSDEYRVILVGDSATWGTLLKPSETLSELINHEQLQTCDGREVRTYNLAYPSMSLTKDLMILEMALEYDPDLIVWPITLESFLEKIQIATPLVANNPHLALPLLQRFNLSFDEDRDEFVQSTFWDRTLIGRRRAIFDAIQLQYYGVMWAATGIDQTYPTNYTPAQHDFELGDDQYQDWSKGDALIDHLAFELLDAGEKLAGNVPILVINEPILISEGENSDLRYNFFYPRWAYDQYRAELGQRANSSAWQFLDLWDRVPQDQFTNSAVHLSPEGSQIYLEHVKAALERLICR